MTTKRRFGKLKVSFFIVSIIAFTILYIASRFCNYDSGATDHEDVVTATVLEVLDTKNDSVVEGYEFTQITFMAEVTSGIHRGDKVEMTQTIDEMFVPVPEAVENGDKIMVMESDVSGQNEWVYCGVNRVGGMVLIVAIFLLMILLIGRGKGIATIISLLLTIGAIFYVYIPSILMGRNVYMLTVAVTVYIVLTSLILLNGFNRKTFCAMAGNVGGTLIAGALALLVNDMLGITGMLDENYMFLMALEGDIAIDLKAVVWGGILIGSLGAIMDVAMSIASAMQEIAEQMKEKSFVQLVRSGMRIGRDAIGTMTNTLILAYVGSSLAVVLLFVAYNKNTLVVMNLEMIVVEVVQAVVGSMGILIAVPLTVFISAVLYMKTPAKSQEQDENNHEINVQKRDNHGGKAKEVQNYREWFDDEE